MVSDGEWTYSVGKTPSIYERAPIQRTNSTGYTETYHFDVSKGISSLMSADDMGIRDYFIKEPGPNYMRLSKTEVVSGGKISTTYRAEFDKDGRLLRETTAGGITRTLKYDGNGKLLGESQERVLDPETKKQLETREQELLTSVRNANSESERDNALQEIGFFYIYQAVDLGKAKELARQITNSNQRFNIMLHAVERDSALTPLSKVQHYRDLSTQFPEQRNMLEQLIDGRKKETQAVNN